MNQQNKVHMSKKKFRIGELAKELQVKKFVIRFWEKEFDLKSDRSQGGQRYYTQDDFKAFNAIKELLYKQGYTIAGAKTKLESELKKSSQISKDKMESKPIKAAIKTIEKPVPYIPEEFMEKVSLLKTKLMELKKSL